MKPIRWIEEHLGWKIDLRFFSRKVWKAYLLHVCPSLVMVFGGGGVAQSTPVQARPQEVKPHVPSTSQSSNITLEGRYLLEVATTSASISHSITNAQLMSVKVFRSGLSGPKQVTPQSRLSPSDMPTDEPPKVNP